MMFEDTEVCISKHTKSTAFLRPVQIMRQTIPNSDMGISPLLAYHNYKGLSSPPGGQGIEKISLIPNTIYTNTPIEGYKGLADMKVWI
jgi:hypothetical protein